MDPDIQLQIEVDVLGMQNIKQLQKEMAGLLSMQSKIADQNQSSVTNWQKLRDELDRIEQKYDAVFRAGFRLQNLGADLIRIGKAMGGMLSDSTDKWGDFEFAMNRAAGALEIFDNQSFIYGKLKTAIYEAAQEARIFPAEDIARATYYWGSTTGQVVKTQGDLKILMNGLVPIMKAAALTETDYETAIKGVYSILIQYRLGLGAARDVTEKLMLITQKTAAEFPDLVNSFKMMGPVASSLGISFDEVVTYLGLLADAGLRGTLTGRALRQTFIKLVDPTKRAKEALNSVFLENDKLGKSFDELLFPDGEFVGFTKYINILATAMEDMNMQQKNQLLGIITTQNELGPLTALINEQIEARKENRNAIEQEKLSLANAHEQFEKMFALLSNSWNGIVGLWQNSVIPIIHLVGAEVARMLTPVLTFFAEVAQAAYRFLVQHPEITEWIVKLTALASAALLLGGIFFSVLGTLFVFAAGVGLAIESLVAVGKHIGGVITKFGVLGLTIGIVAAILITDFGGIAGAVGSVIALLGEVAKVFGEAFVQAGRTIEFFTGIVGGALALVDEFFSLLGNINFSATSRQLGFVSFLWEAFGFIVKTVGGTLLGFAATALIIYKSWMALKTAVLAVRAAWIALIGMKAAVAGFFLVTSNVVGLTSVLGAARTAVLLFGTALKIAFLSNPIGAGIALAILAIGGLVLAVRHAGDVINNFAMDFGDMGDELHRVADETGQSYQTIKDQVQAAMREHNLSFEEAVAQVENYSVSSDYATRHMDELTSAAQQNTIGMSDLEAQLGMTTEEMEAAGIATPALQDALSGVAGEVDDVTEALEKANWADSLVGQLAIAAQQSRIEARRIPSEIAAGILEGRNDVIQAAKGLGDAVTYELMNDARVGELRVQMDEAAATIQEAIIEGTPGALAAAQAQYQKLELELAGYLLTIDPTSKEAAGILEKYITEGDPATQAAAQALYSALEDKALISKYNIEQYALDMGIAPENALKLFKASTILEAELLALGIETPVEELVGQIQTHGEDAMTGLAAAITRNARVAGTATGEVKKEAEANLILLRDIAQQYGLDTTDEFAEGVRLGERDATDAAKRIRLAVRGKDGLNIGGEEWYGGGASIIESWANGMYSAIDYVNGIAYGISAMVANQLVGFSPPKEGPLRSIDIGGRNIGLAWGSGLLSAAPQIARDAAALAGTVRDNLMVGGSNTSFGTSFDSEHKNRIELDVNVTSSDGSVTDANAQSIADAIQQGLMLDRLEHMVRVG